MASVGPLEEGPKLARMSVARRLNVLPSVMSSVRHLGTRVEVRVLISACIRALPAYVLGER